MKVLKVGCFTCELVAFPFQVQVLIGAHFSVEGNILNLMALRIPFWVKNYEFCKNSSSIEVFLGINSVTS